MYDKYIESMKNNQFKDVEIATLKRKLKRSKVKKLARAQSKKSEARLLDFTLSPTSRSNYSNKYTLDKLGLKRARSAMSKASFSRSICDTNSDI